MSAKDNFNEAMFDMFGVGKSSDSATPSAAEKPVEAYTPRTSPNCTYLAPGTVMEGKLFTKNDVEIAGDFTGDITSEGKVSLRSNMQGNVNAANLQLFGCRLVGDIHVSGVAILDEQSSVAGNIHANELLCSGLVKGDLYVQGNVTLNEKASIEGNITTDTMTMMRGASISGNLKMNCVSKASTAPKQDSAEQ